MTRIAAGLPGLNARLDSEPGAASSVAIRRRLGDAMIQVTVTARPAPAEDSEPVTVTAGRHGRWRRASRREPLSRRVISEPAPPARRLVGLGPAAARRRPGCQFLARGQARAFLVGSVTHAGAAACQCSSDS
jgi:hypothetical protein